jgi:uncharacterized protein (TIGR02145 family)
MKNFTILCLMLFAIAKSYSQDYLISFAGTGASTTFDSVKVDNITQNKSITVPGGNQLRLKAEFSGILSLSDNTESALRIYPNPAREYSIVELDAIKGGSTTFEVFDLSGKQVAKMQLFLASGKHSFSISGLGSGVYTIKVKMEDNYLTGRIISQSDSKRNVQIRYNGKSGEIENSNVNLLKSTATESTMQYTDGDRLKLKGISGIYSTIFMIVPTQSQTVIFNFTACTDADSNHYTVVQIGAQIWMVENLNATHYRNGDPIPNVTDATAWSNLATGAYCDYSNTPGNSTIYGKLYNFYTVDDSRNLCPTGWHVPTDAEWTTLTTVLGGESVAGGKLKETSTTHWKSPNAGATNESGFTALPGGNRDIGGTFSRFGNSGFWWGSADSSTGKAWYRDMEYNDDVVITVSSNKKNGYSVLCVRDQAM